MVYSKCYQITGLLLYDINSCHLYHGIHHYVNLKLECHEIQIKVANFISYSPTKVNFYWHLQQIVTQNVTVISTYEATLMSHENKA
jgi:hypothetical protein